MKKIDKKELSELFIGIRENNIKAFEKLYSHYNKLVYSIAFSIVKNEQDAEDIVQIVFSKIYSIDKNKLPSKSEASWLYSVTKNETINYWKKRNNTINIEDIYEIEEPNSQIDRIIDKEKYNNLISGLCNKEKEIISLKLLANLSFDEIGKILKMPTGTVKWKYYKAIYALKIALSNLGMFIITVMLGIITMKEQSKTNLQNNIETNCAENENVKEDITETTTKEDFDRVENEVLENDNSQLQENLVEVPVENNNTNYIGITFIGISILFFIIAIIFSIIYTKHQLKRRKNMSK